MAIPWILARMRIALLRARWRFRIDWIRPIILTRTSLPETPLNRSWTAASPTSPVTAGDKAVLLVRVPTGAGRSIGSETTGSGIPTRGVSSHKPRAVFAVVNQDSGKRQGAQARDEGELEWDGEVHFL
ncbi:hypothetical protein ACKVWC_010097 [Pyricularia oryzae]